jgi:hypothetical protein
VNWTKFNVATDLLFTGIIAVATVVNVIIASCQWSVMVESNGINRTNMEVSQRAFVISNSLRLITYGAQHEGGDPNLSPRWIVTPIIENVGNTQTRHMKFGSNVAVASTSKVAWDTTLDAEAGFSRSMIGPKSEITSGVIWAGPNILMQLQQQKAFVAGMGIVKYQDIFGKRRLTEFCYIGQIHPIDFQKFPVGQPIRVYGIPCPEHNCADDECGPDWLERAK